jgi:Fe2+ transport system protein FeoA
VKITEEKAETLKRLAKLQLVPGERVTVENKNGSSGSLTVHVGDDLIDVDEKIASIIYVKTNGEVEN